MYPYLQKSQQKRKGGQIRFTNEQTHELEKKFDGQKYLSPQERKKLAKTLQLSERQVRILMALALYVPYENLLFLGKDVVPKSTRQVAPIAQRQRRRYTAQ